MYKICGISFTSLLLFGMMQGFAAGPDQAVKAIEKAGGSVSVETKNGEKLLRVDINAGTKITDSDLSTLAGLPGICILDL